MERVPLLFFEKLIWRDFFPKTSKTYEYFKKIPIWRLLILTIYWLGTIFCCSLLSWFWIVWHYFIEIYRGKLALLDTLHLANLVFGVFATFASCTIFYYELYGKFNFFWPFYWKVYQKIMSQFYFVILESTLEYILKFGALPKISLWKDLPTSCESQVLTVPHIKLVEKWWEWLCACREHSDPTFLEILLEFLVKNNGSIPMWTFFNLF